MSPPIRLVVSPTPMSRLNGVDCTFIFPAGEFSNGKFGSLFPKGKPAATGSRYLISLPNLDQFLTYSACCIVCVILPSAMRPTLLWQINMGSLKSKKAWDDPVKPSINHSKRAQMRVCAVRIRKRVGHKRFSLHESWLRGVEQLSLTLPHQYSVSKPGPSDLKSDAVPWTTTPIIFSACCKSINNI